MTKTKVSLFIKILSLALLFGPQAVAEDYKGKASDVRTNTSAFNNALTSSENTVQKALDVLDNVAVTASSTNTLTNKSMNADGTGNTITNIEDENIKAAAAIALNKLAATTASRALASDGSGFISATAVTSTELGYLSGATSSIQTQINNLASGAGGWTKSGTNITNTTLTDNVGIGTHTPSSKLQVVGTVNATAFVGDGSGLTGMGSIDEIYVANNAFLDGGNTNSPKKNQITTSPDGLYQYIVYWDEDEYLTTCQRTIATQRNFTCYQQTGIEQIILADSHYVPSIGVDPNGYIHLNYNNWANALNYRKSTNPNDISAFGPEITMGGTAETQVTYMIFFNDYTEGGKLYATYRDGSSGNGDQYVKVYDHTTGTWSTLPGTSSGKLIDGKSTLDSAYPYGPPKFDDAGNAHFAFTWWDSNISTYDAHDVFYTKWDKASQTFKKSTGASQTVPITQANWDLAAAVAKRTGITSNGAGLDIDVNGNPYIAFTKRDANGKSQTYVTYSDGATWTVKQLTFAGKDGRYGYPQVFADREAGKFYVVQGSAVVQTRVIETNDNFATWETYKITSMVGPSSPLYDYTRWHLHKILDILSFSIAPFKSTITIKEWSPGFKTSSLFENDYEDFTIPKNVVMNNPAPQFTNATTYNFMDGVVTVGGGVSFGILYGGSGSDDRTTLPSDVVNDPMTIHATLRTSDLTNNQTIVAKHGGSGNFGWRFAINTSGYLFLTTSSNASTTTNRVATSLPLSINTTYKVAVVYNGTSATFYVNGTAATDNGGTVNANTASSTVDALIGSYTSGGSSFLDELEGTMYDLQIYHSALSAGDISTLNSTDVPLSTVTYWWPHSEGTGTTLSEMIDGVNGTLTGATWSGSTTDSGLNGEGDLYVKDDFEVNGTSYFSGSVNLMGSSVGIGTTMNTSGLSVMNGNAGIGTWNPTSKLQVVGTVAATAFSGDGSGLTNLPPVGGWTDGGTNIYNTATTDFVGIGTSTPTAQLLVENVGTQDSFRVNDAASDTTPFIVTSIGNVGIGTVSPQSKFNVVNGNVGIGTTVVERLLDMATTGNYGIRLTFLGPSDLTTASRIVAAVNDGSPVDNTHKLGEFLVSGYTGDQMLETGGMYGVARGTWNTTSAPTELRFDTTDTGSLIRSHRMTILPNGNVGIGTIDPSTNFHIVGNARISGLTAGRCVETSTGGLLTVASGACGTGGGGVGVGTVNPGVVGAIPYYSASTTLDDSPVMFTDGVNIGISTTGPTQKLQVVGTIAATALTGDGSGLTGVGASALATDSVSADELNATGVEAELEAVLDLQDQQGAVTDAQVPNNITVDNATTAANLGADGVDALTEIAQGIKTAADDTSKIVVGTAGSTDDCAKWDSTGALISAGAACGGAAGAWVDGGTNVYVSPTTDNVGIGTTTPTAALLVENAGTQTSFRVNDSAVDTTPFLIDSAGNVGIGTSSAGSKLVVGSTGQITFDASGNVAFSSSTGGTDTLNIVNNSLTTGSGLDISSSSASHSAPLVILTQSGNASSTVLSLSQSGSSSSGGTLNISQSGASSTGRAVIISNLGLADTLYITDESSDPTPFVINSAGNVGIGTTGPTQKLHVVGTVSATNFVGDGSGLTNLPSTSGGWSDGGTNVYTSTTTDLVGIGTTSPSTTLEIVKQGSSAPLMVSSTATGDGNYMIITSSGNVGIGTLLPRGPLDLGPTGTLYTQTITGPTGPTILGTSNNVGVGTTTAGSLLTVGSTGQLTVSSSGALSTSSTVSVGDDAYAAGWNGSTAVPTKNAVYDKIETISGGTGGWTDGSAVVYVSVTTDKVGIGTTIPTASLDIKQSGAKLRLNNAGTGANVFATFGDSNGNDVLEFGLESGGDFRLSNTGNFGLWLGTNDARRFSINNNGNVGIGTTAANPGAKFVITPDNNQSGKGACIGTGNCIGYCTAGTWPNCSTCTCF